MIPLKVPWAFLLLLFGAVTSPLKLLLCYLDNTRHHYIQVGAFDICMYFVHSVKKTEQKWNTKKQDTDTISKMVNAITWSHIDNFAKWPL